MRLLSVLPLLSSITLAACAGSPATQAMQPDFEVSTAAGPASVSVRGAPPDMTTPEFEHLVEVAMSSAMPTIPATAVQPFPDRRIVWHVDAMPPHGTSRLAVNIFNGSVPFSYHQEVIDDSAPRSMTVYAVRALSGRIAVTLDGRDQEAAS
jgi:hypothetical protein